MAAASWDIHGPIRHIGVITHPAHRGQGLAPALGSAITAAALAENAIPQWQTLLANAPSLAIGRTLGFIERYQSIARGCSSGYRPRVVGRRRSLAAAIAMPHTIIAVSAPPVTPRNMASTRFVSAFVPRTS